MGAFTSQALPHSGARRPRDALTWAVNAGLISADCLSAFWLHLRICSPSRTSVCVRFSTGRTDGSHALLRGVSGAGLDRGGARALAAIWGPRVAAS